MKKALITGGSSALGKALAKELLRCYPSLSLLLTGRDENKLRQIQQELAPHQVDTLVLDLLQPQALHQLGTWIDENTPDLVINNAGIGLYGDALSHPIEEQLQILQLNAHALLKLSLQAAHSLHRAHQQGIILNISSAADALIYPTLSVYSASKAFVTSVSKSLDEELKPHGIRVLVSSPGQINTDFKKNASKGYFQSINPRALSPEQAAKHLLWQIHKRKKAYVFPMKVRLGRFLLLHFLPEAWRTYLLKRGLRNRYPKH
jgi:short-subunit dehydrogenase